MNQPYESEDYLKHWKWLVPFWLRPRVRSAMHRRHLDQVMAAKASGTFTEREPGPDKRSITVDETDTSVPKTDSQRKHILAIEVGKLVSQGYRIESQSEFQAVLAVGQRPNHILHAIITIFTFFVWGIVWIAISMSNRVRRVVLTVDEWGILQYQQAT